VASSYREQPEPVAKGEEVLNGVQSSQATPETHSWFYGFAPSDDKDQEDYFQDDN
jgi:hypothetical protein